MLGRLHRWRGPWKLQYLLGTRGHSDPLSALLCIELLPELRIWKPRWNF